MPGFVPFYYKKGFSPGAETYLLQEFLSA